MTITRIAIPSPSKDSPLAVMQRTVEAVNLLQGVNGPSTQRAVRVFELLDIGLVQLQPSGALALGPAVGAGGGGDGDTLPGGGLSGQALIKATDADGDAVWASLGIPSIAGLQAALDAAAAALTAHEAAADPHPQYLTAADLVGLYEPAGAVAAHVAAADPHPQYLTAAEGAAAFAPVVHGHTITDVALLEDALLARVAKAGDTMSGDLLFGLGVAARWLVSPPAGVDPAVVIRAEVVGDALALVPSGTGTAMLALSPTAGAVFDPLLPLRVGADDVWHEGNFDPDQYLLTAAAAALYAPIAHTHSIANVTGLGAALDGKVSASGDTMTGPLQISVNSALSITTAGDDLISLQGIGRIFHFGTSLGANTLAITNLGASTVDLLLDDAGLDVYRPRIRVGSNEVWHAGNLLNIGTTAASARTALGLGSMALAATGDYVTLAGAETISGGKTFTAAANFDAIINRRVTGGGWMVQNLPAGGGASRGGLWSDDTGQRLVNASFGAAVEVRTDNTLLVSASAGATHSAASTFTGAFVVTTGGYLVNRRDIPRVFLESPNQVNGYVLDANVSNTVFDRFRILRRDNSAELLTLTNFGALTVGSVTTAGDVTTGGYLISRRNIPRVYLESPNTINGYIVDSNVSDAVFGSFRILRRDTSAVIFDLNNAAQLTGLATITTTGAITAGGTLTGRTQTRAQNADNSHSLRMEIGGDNSKNLLAAGGVAPFYIGNQFGVTDQPVYLYNNNAVRVTIAASGAVTIAGLAGSGDRMVVANASGVLSTQAIPGGGGGPYLELAGGMMTGDLDIDHAVSSARLRFYVQPPLAPDPAEYINLGISSGALVVSDDVAGDMLTLSPSTGATIHSLAGSGTRMVVAGGGGLLSTQAIPASGATWLRQASTVNNTTPGTASNTDLQFTAAASTRYLLRGYCRYTSAATTTGIQPVITGPAGTTVYGKFTVRTATAIGTDSEQVAPVTAISSPVGFGTATTTDGWLEFWVIAETSATAGTLGLRFQSEISGSSVQIVAGSVMSYAVLP